MNRFLHHESLEDRQLLDGHGLAAAGEPVAEFSLLDVNPTSPRFNESVSPSDYSGQTTAWYFIHST